MKNAQKHGFCIFNHLVDDPNQQLLNRRMDQQIDLIFAAMADATRRSILTLLLEDEIDASRGNTLVIANNKLKTEKLINAKICWMQNETLNPNGKYWLQQGVYKCLIKVKEVTAKMDWESWKSLPTQNLNMNDIGEVALQLAQPLLHAPYHKNKNLGAFILIDSHTNNTAGVGFIQ